MTLLETIEEMRSRAIALWLGACKPTPGRFTLAVKLWEWADKIDESIGRQPPPSEPTAPRASRPSATAKSPSAPSSPSRRCSKPLNF